MKIEYTDQLSIAEGVKAVVYGASGAGKTVLASTAESPFIFSAEKGLLSLKKSKVAYTTIDTYKDLTEAAKWAIGSSETKRFKSFALDSLSEIAEVVLAEELKKTKDPRRAYGEMQQQMYQIMRLFRDIRGKNIVFIAKQFHLEQTEGFQVTKKVVPLMPSAALQNQVPYFFDLVLHLYIAADPATNKTYRAVRTQPTKDWEAKDRSGNLDAIEPPDLTHIFGKACQ